MRIVRVEGHRLSDGGIVEVIKLGRVYAFNQYGGAEMPDCHIAIPKNVAMRLLADALARDNLELGH